MDAEVEHAVSVFRHFVSRWDQFEPGTGKRPSVARHAPPFVSERDRSIKLALPPVSADHGRNGFSERRRWGSRRGHSSLGHDLNIVVISHPGYGAEGLFTGF